jgi:prephenate dehydratase
VQSLFQTHPQLKSVVADDTAGSVAEVIRRGDRKARCQSPDNAPRSLRRDIIRKSIQDHSENYTRFVLLAAQPHQRPKEPTLLVKEHAS